MLEGYGMILLASQGRAGQENPSSSKQASKQSSMEGRKGEKKKRKDVDRSQENGFWNFMKRVGWMGG